MVLVVALGACGAGHKDVQGNDHELAKVAGEWEGDYKGADSGRSGPVTFSLQLGRHVAEGEVVMSGITPLEIAFVQLPALHPDPELRDTNYEEEFVNRTVKIVLTLALLALATSPATGDDKVKPALTLEAYEKLVLGLADCKLKGYSIDSACPGLKTMQAAMKDTTRNMQDVLGMNATLGAKLIGHTSVAVRVKAAELMASFTGTKSSSQDTIVAAAAREKDPQVLQAFIRTVANDGAKNAKVAAMLIASADHADKDVRLQAVYAISSGWNREMKGGPEKLAALAEKDAEPKVRQAACEYGGKLGQKAMLPVLEKLTAKADDKAMYAACMAGLGAMFHQYPLYPTDNEAAYKLFLKRLDATPRSETTPPWGVMSLFRHAGDAKNDKLAAWKKRATWFKVEDVKKALAAVIADKQTNWMARTAAIESYAALGAKKAELEALKKGYDEKDFKDKNVLKKIDEAAAKAP